MGLTPKSRMQVGSSLCTCLGPPVIHLMCISVSATAVNGLIFHLHSPGCSITAEPWSCPCSFTPSQNSSCCCTQSPDSSSLRLFGKYRCGCSPTAPNPAGKEQREAQPGAASGEDSSPVLGKAAWGDWAGWDLFPLLHGEGLPGSQNQTNRMRRHQFNFSLSNNSFSSPGLKLGQTPLSEELNQPCPRCDGRKAPGAQTGLFFHREEQMNKARPFSITIFAQPVPRLTFPSKGLMVFLFWKYLQSWAEENKCGF